MSNPKVTITLKQTTDDNATVNVVNEGCNKLEALSLLSLAQNSL
jgi:hypothetical protein